jgi:leucyl aminopeptidase (aminopeptidase T)
MDYSLFSHQALDVCLGLKKEDRVWINSWDHTVDVASHLAWECRNRGFETLLTLQPEELWLRSLQEGPVELLDKLTSQQAAALQETDAYIFTLGPRSPVPWERIPPERLSSATVWFLEQNKFVGEWKRIARRRKVKMLGIEATLATPERAKALGLDSEHWREVMFAGCMADYHEIAALGRKLTSILQAKGEVHIRTPHGTDVKFALDARLVKVADGLATEERAKQGEVVFLPSGVVEVTAKEDSAEGPLVYDRPIYSTSGTVKNLTLSVADGRITNSNASEGLEVFEKYVETSGRDADRFACFGLGLNPKLRYGFTQDDKVLGAVVVNFGESESKGGKNRAGRDWWGSMTHATVEINGEAVMVDGNLRV